MADLQLIRSDLAAFAEAAGSPLEQWQTSALTLATRTTAIVAPRQSGKSRSLSALALWWAFRKPGQRVLIVSAGEEASRRLLAQVRRTAAGSQLLAGSVADEQAGLITLTNGSEVRSVPASERQVRGWSVDLLLVDEAAMVADDLLLGAAFPTTAARPDARIVLASSAYVAGGAFFDQVRLGEAGSEHVRSHRWALGDCWWITPSMIEAARESMSETRFRAEYEGVFSSGADALFTRAAIERATADYVVTELEDLVGPARLLGGVDWGATVDRSTLVAIGRVPAREPLFAVACAQRWPAGAPLAEVIDQIARAPAHFDTLAMETNGLGLPCTQELSRRILERPADAGGGERARGVAMVDAERVDQFLAQKAAHRASADGRRRFHTRRLAVHTSAELKAAAYSTLRLLIDRGQLLLPAAGEDLLRELLMLRVDLTPSGGERIEASNGGHDDLADALMLATCPHRDRRGRWATLLGHYAQRGQRVPPPAVAGAIAPDVETVSSGGGVEVPRVPVWQPVRGPELTVPRGLNLNVQERPGGLARGIRDQLAGRVTDPNQRSTHDVAQ